MPPYRFLFEKRKINQAPSADALVLEGEQTLDPGYELVPTDEAKALVAYLLSLRSDVPLFEAPFSSASVASTLPSPAVNAPTSP